MSATLIECAGDRVKVEVSLELSRSMLNTEEAIQSALNEAGRQLSGEALKYFDTDGSPIVIGGEVWRTKGVQPKAYQTPYGEVSIERQVYQRSGGGQTYCPLERDARIVVTSTPKFAKQVSSKSAYGPASTVQRDLTDNHGRPVAKSCLQRLTEAVASVVQAKEEHWQYVPPALDQAVATVAVGLDGTCMLLCEGGWREAMVGTVSLYDGKGQRQHTIYLGATPEYGKATFLARLTREVERTKVRYPEATYIGIADGADTNWRFLEPHTDAQILDFYHASSYLSAVATAAYP
ncbi:MAG: ISKra4 family transposase, partial [Gammaproteobacteria bacterium]|nr:ISKra4 family transposase [Gammaproteobacteria bacterium]